MGLRGQTHPARSKGACSPFGMLGHPRGRRLRTTGPTRDQTGKTGFKTTLSDLEPGDFVVHIDHGVGVFDGLTRLNVRGAEQDYLKLKYLGDDTFFLPVHRINQIQKYTVFKGKEPKLDKLGGNAWQSKKKKSNRPWLRWLRTFLALYAKRELIQRPFAPRPTSITTPLKVISLLCPRPTKRRPPKKC